MTVVKQSNRTLQYIFLSILTQSLLIKGYKW